jgi:hypothetical protein
MSRKGAFDTKCRTKTDALNIKYRKNARWTIDVTKCEIEIKYREEARWH